jgi:aminoglycoside phosphotransferase (APT) family kinase protein
VSQTGDLRGRRAELTEWLAARMGDPSVSIDCLERMSIGQSNDTFSLDVTSASSGRSEVIRLVLRTTPSGPGLVEPYDMAKQFNVLDALSRSDVPVPDVRWLELDESVLGRPFFVMDRLDGTVFELTVPDYVREGGPEKLHRMSLNFVDTFARLHEWDWESTPLANMDRGPGSAVREVDWWASEIDRVKRGPHPALDALADWLRRTAPPPPLRYSLLHGDCKWGNVMWDDERVAGVLDWEMAQVGDPLIDIGYATMLWDLGGPATIPGVISSAEFLEIYQKATGADISRIQWYQVLATFKVVAICLVGSMLFAEGKSESLRYAAFGCGIGGMTKAALAKAGLEEDLTLGTVMADPQLIADRVTNVVHGMLLPELDTEEAEAQALAIPMLFSYYTHSETAGQS